MNRLRQLEEVIRQNCGGRKRALLVDHIWPAFERIYGQLPDGKHPRPMLLDALEEMRDEGRLAFPKGSASFDRMASPALPNWIEWTESEDDRPDQGLLHREYPWHPQLAWVAGLNTLGNPEPLLAIDRFLKGPARTAMVVPARERSLALFGDEKYLDRLLGSVWFSEGRLTLDLLKCERVPPPFVYASPTGPPASSASELLVLENHHTWHSFARWNNSALRYAAVVYGGGKQFEASVAGIEDLAQTLGVARISYFGDLDVEGIAIPARANRWQLLRGLRPIEPAGEWYRALLETRHDHRHESVGRTRLDEDLLEWLPEDCRMQARNLIEHQQRLPQEYIGTEYLQKLGGHR